MKYLPKQTKAYDLHYVLSHVNWKYFIMISTSALIMRCQCNEMLL